MNESILPVDPEIKEDMSLENIESIDNIPSKVETNIDVEFAKKLEAYEMFLTELLVSSPPSHESILRVLLERDDLQTILENKEKKSTELLFKLLALDEQLKKQGAAIAKEMNLSQWRNTLHPSPNSWWWFFEAVPSPQKVDPWDRFDWAWNLLTVLCLTGFVSFASKILPLVLSNGLSVFESIGLLGPGGMVALVLSSMRGGEGQKKVQNILSSVGIPARFQSEATFLIAFLLFAGGYIAEKNLPRIYFNSFVTEGQKAYRNSDLREARDNYELALKVENQDRKAVAEVYTNLGLLSESVGDNNEAQKYYYRAIDLGGHSALNNLGRVKIQKRELDAAETFLNMGIQRVDPTDIPEQYQLYRNLGWAYLEQKRYSKAESSLAKAIDLDKQIPRGNIGSNFGKGIANCLQARVYELQKKPDQAANQWKICVDIGVPETLHEYETILKMNPEAGTKINTQGVFK